MTSITDLGSAVWRDWNTDAVPSSGARRVPKADIRDLMAAIDQHKAEVADSLTSFRAQTAGPKATFLRKRASVYDGSSGWFVYDPDDTTTADDGAMTIVDAAGRRHKRIENVLFSPRWFGAKGDGVTDDTAALQAACDYQAARGGGKVDCTGGNWLIDSADLELGRGVVLSGPWLMPGTGAGYLRIDISVFRAVIIVNPAYTVRFMGDSAGIEGLAIYNKDVFNGPTPTTLRENLDRINLFGGVGITVGDGTSYIADDCSIRNCFIGGFEHGIYIDFNSRPRIDHIFGDNHNGLYITKCYDMDYISNVHFWPGLTPAGGPTAYKAYAVIGVTDNGAGLCRVEVSEDHILETGDKNIVINGAGGVPNVNTSHDTVTRVDARKFDVPAAFSGSYTSGGTVHVSVFKRSGIGVFVDTDTDWAQLVTVFCYGYKTGIKVKDSDHAKLVNVGADNYSVVGDRTTRGIWVYGDCSNATLIGCKAAAQGVNFDCDINPTYGPTVSLLGCDAWGATLYGARATRGHMAWLGGHVQEFNAVRVEVAGTMSFVSTHLVSVNFSYASGAKRIETNGCVGTTYRNDVVSSGTSGIRVASRTTAINSAPASNDGLARTIEVTDSGGTAVEIFRETAKATDVTAGAVTSQVYWGLRSAGLLVDKLLLTTTILAPVANGGLAMGSPTLGWSGACFSANTQLNWGNGAYTLTQGGVLLTASGSFAAGGYLAAGTYVKTGVYTVGTLPSASGAGSGARAMVTDANATTFLSTVAGGGSNIVPVVSNGANWLIG